MRWRAVPTPRHPAAAIATAPREPDHRYLRTGRGCSRRSSNPGHTAPRPRPRPRRDTAPAISDCSRASQGPGRRRVRRRLRRRWWQSEGIAWLIVRRSGRPTLQTCCGSNPQVGRMIERRFFDFDLEFYVKRRGGRRGGGDSFPGRPASGKVILPENLPCPRAPCQQGSRGLAAPPPPARAAPAPSGGHPRPPGPRPEGAASRPPGHPPRPAGATSRPQGPSPGGPGPPKPQVFPGTPLASLVLGRRPGR